MNKKAKIICRFSKNFRKIRKERKLTQEELAFRCGINTKTIYYLEHMDESDIHHYIEICLAIEKNLGVSLFEIENYNEAE